MLSLKQHFSEVKIQRDAAKVSDDTFEDDFVEISLRVDEWNRKITDVREARENKKRIEEEIRILEDIECRQKEQEEERLRLNELIRLEKVSSSVYVIENIVSNKKLTFAGGGEVIYCT